MGGRKKIEFRGQTFVSLASLCAHYGVSSHTVSHRLNKGMTLEEAISKPIRVKASPTTVNFRGTEYKTIADLVMSYGYDIHFFKWTRNKVGLSDLETLELLEAFFSKYGKRNRPSIIHCIPYAIKDDIWYNTCDLFEESLGFKPERLKSYIKYHRKTTGVDLSVKRALIKMQEDEHFEYRETSTGNFYTRKYIEYHLPEGVETLLKRGVITREKTRTYPNLVINPNTLFTPKHDFNKFVKKFKNESGVR